MGLSDYRPISLTPILSRVFEKIFVRSYFHPLILSENVAHEIKNQFAFRPTGSTTATLIQILHTVTCMPTANQYVHVVALDFSEVSNTVRHSTLVEF